MRNSWARVGALVALSVFSLSDVTFGIPVCPAPASNGTNSGSQNTSSPAVANNGTAAVAAASGADFGSCTTPEIKFAAGFDGRKETSFEPVDQTSYNHGSAQNIAIITQFMCDNLVNTCNANQAAKTLCAQAQTAANSATPAKTGIQADTFNNFFGFKTDFASVQALSDQGVPLDASGATGASNSTGQGGSSSTAANNGTAVAQPAGAADFGSCPTPEIKFAVGLDGRKETAFAPVDQTAFNHGSADNIAVITQFMCNNLVNSCKANQAAQTLCAQAQTAASSATPAQTGGQADAFNSVMGIKTNFASVQQISNTGQPVGTPASQSGQGSTAANNGSTVAQPATPANNGSAPATASGAADFGSCTTPEIKFAAGLDGRKETAFAPVDQTSYNHGSAQNIAIITQFMCDNLVNTCNANQAAKTLCAQAQTAANSATPAKTGIQADTFNNVFGIKTDFAAVQALSDQGVPLDTSGATGASSSTSSSTPAPTPVTPATSVVPQPTQPTTGNLQTFTGSLGATPPAVTAAGNGKFQVAGNALFNDQQNAIIRSCDVQHNQCANAANASGNQGQLTVAACGTQQTQCNAAASA